MTTATSGAGIADSYAGLVNSITNSSESDAERVADVAISAAGAVVDTVMALEDPLNALINAGVGWLLQHVAFLREPLDMLLGNPDEINAQISQLKTGAAQVRAEAQAHSSNMNQVGGWKGPAGDNYKSQMDQLSGELTSIGHTLDGSAAVVAVSGTLVMTIRGLVYGLISQFIADIIEKALLALAASWCTLGGSVAAFIGDAVIQATEVGTKITSKLTKLLEGLGANAERLEQLAKMMETLNKNLGRFGMIAGTAKSVYDSAQPIPVGEPSSAPSSRPAEEPA